MSIKDYIQAAGAFMLLILAVIVLACLPAIGQWLPMPIGAGRVTTVYATLDPLHVGSGVVLSSGNLAARLGANGNANITTATSKFRTGTKSMFEVKLFNPSVSTGLIQVAGCLNGQATNGNADALGNVTMSAAYRSSGSWGISYDWTGTLARVGTGRTAVDADIIGIAYDEPNRLLHFLVNGVENDASPVSVPSGAGDIWPAVMVFVGGATAPATSILCNFGATSFAYPIPGYTGIY